MSAGPHSSRFLSIALILVGLVELPGCGKQGAGHGEMLAANRELDRQLAGAFLAKDIDGIMRCWWNNPAATTIPADGIEGRRGYDAIKRAVKFQLDGIEKVVRYEFVEQRYEVYGDAVVGSGKTLFTLRPVGAPKDVELSIRYTNVRQMKEGRWVYVYSHESMQTPTPFN